MSYRTRNIAIASGLALLAVVFMIVYVSKARHSSSSAAGVGKGVVSVLFAAQDITAGTPGSDLQSGAFVTRTVPASAAVPDSISSPTAVRGEVATTDILKGEAVTARKFAPMAAAGVRSRIVGLERVVQVAGDENQILDGTLKPGDRVDILGSWNTPENCGSCHVSRVVVPNVLVVATSAEIGAGDQGLAPIQLRLTASEAARVFWLSKNGDWWLTLRPVVKPRSGGAGAESSRTLLQGAE
jgi:Flp pilus assembly protein CpaB